MARFSLRMRAPKSPLEKATRMKLTSRAFEHGGRIPVRYTCDGEDVNPPLDIVEVPPGTRSLTLIVDDPDAPKGVWTHWVVYNSAVLTHIGEGDIPGDQAMNDFDQKAYGGPCPHTGAHRYFFRLYALDCMLDLAHERNREQVEQKMRGHVLAEAELMGTYSRNA
jgi:Raf kinase inhibitor-like YbhB/YbcL family protein